MSALEIYGWACALVGSVLALPQLYKLVKTRTSAGLSVLMWQLNVSVNSAWTIHGLLFRHPNMYVPNAFLGICGVLILLQIIRDRSLAPWRVLGLPTLLVIVMALLDLQVSIVYFGLMISALQLIGAIAQFIDLVKLPDIRGVSFVYLVQSIVVNVMWLIWGLWAGDISIIMAASSMGVMVIINTIWWLLRSRGLVRPRPGSSERLDGRIRADAT